MKNLSFIPNTFIFGTQDIFDEIQELSDPDSNANEMFKAQKCSKDMVKIVHVTLAVQP